MSDETIIQTQFDCRTIRVEKSAGLTRLSVQNSDDTGLMPHFAMFAYLDPEQVNRLVTALAEQPQEPVITIPEDKLRSLVYAIEARLEEASEALAPIFKDDRLTRVGTKISAAMDALLEIREELGQPSCGCTHTGAYDCYAASHNMTLDELFDLDGPTTPFCECECHPAEED